MRPHPFTTWPRRHRAAALVALTVPSALFILWSAVAQPLGDEDIVAFEFAWTVGRAEEILAAWRAEDVIGLAQAMQLADLVYPFLYASAIAGGCVGAAAAWRRAGNERMAEVANTLAWVATSAIVFDYVENLGLAVSLWGEPAAPWPQLAFVAAVLKFAAILAGLVGVLSWPSAARRAR
jgi:hypothetical protein